MHYTIKNLKNKEVKKEIMSHLNTIILTFYTYNLCLNNTNIVGISADLLPFQMPNSKQCDDMLFYIKSISGHLLRWGSLHGLIAREIEVGRFYFLYIGCN